VAFAMGLGALNLVLVHGKHILKQTKGQWLFSVVLFISMIVPLVFGVFGGLSNQVFTWSFNNLFSPLSQAVFASLAFWMASASYRVLRLKNLESSIFMIAAIVMLFRNIALGEMISSSLPAFGLWLLLTPTNAVNRGIMITAAVGAIALGLRVLLGYEKVYG
jgi:hypothetical protein